MTVHEYSIALRIRHPSIAPDELSRAIGFEPQHSWRRGEPRRSASGETLSGVYRETYWVGFVPTLAPNAPNAFDPQAILLFTLLKMKRAGTFWRDLVEQGGTVECLIEIVSGDSFTLDLSPALLSLLVQLRIGLTIGADPVRRAVAA
jgi:Domain of unknown function (DUF4279)